jgi:hypothetical protein
MATMLNNRPTPMDSLTRSGHFANTVGIASNAGEYGLFAAESSNSIESRQDKTATVHRPPGTGSFFGTKNVPVPLRPSVELGRFVEEVANLLHTGQVGNLPHK